MQNQKNPILSPPPLIPISILNTSKSDLEHLSVSLPKLQLIPKAESMESEKSDRNPSQLMKKSKIKSSKHAKYMIHNNSGGQANKVANESRPYDKFSTQNIATIGRQKFIVVPTNSLGLLRVTNVISKEIGNRPTCIGSADNIPNAKVSTEALISINTTTGSKKLSNYINIPFVKPERFTENFEEIIPENHDLQVHKLFHFNQTLPNFPQSVEVNPGISGALQHDLAPLHQNNCSNQDLTVDIDSPTEKIR